MEEPNQLCNAEQMGFWTQIKKLKKFIFFEFSKTHSCVKLWIINTIYLID